MFTVGVLRNVICILVHLKYAPGYSITVKTLISLRIHPGWSLSSLSARRRFGPLTAYRLPCEDSDQTARMHRLICVFPERKCNLVGHAVPGSYDTCIANFFSITLKISNLGRYSQKLNLSRRKKLHFDLNLKCKETNVSQFISTAAKI